MRDELEQLRIETDFYRRLLDLSTEHDVERFLREALVLALELTGATRGYLELNDPSRPASEPRWALSQGCDRAQVEGIRLTLSRGIIAEAMATQTTVATSSALLDPRFGGRESVRGSGIEAVLCAPIGRDPVRGVIYLAGATRGESWLPEERSWVELFARHFAPLVDSILERQPRRSGEDPMKAIPPGFGYEGIVGHSAALARVLQQAALLAPLELPVLMTGDSGTGKSQLAAAIHRNSPRRARLFVEVNCGALPEELIESELFGAKEGAHSTARRARAGRVAEAEGGTLFLDEIAELSPRSQAKLLQLVQTGTYYVLGAAEPSHADIRIIAATNIDLTRAIAEKRFREDLYYRLCVLPLRMPSLAERASDVAELSHHFAAQASQTHRLPRLELSPRAVRALEAAEWPGNVRQLAHTIEAGAIRATGERAARIDVGHLFPERAHANDDSASEPVTFQEATRRFQRELLEKTLVETEWNVSEAARRLDLARSHVYTLISAFDLMRK
ncbi:MAG TPA: sigma 54-interacting transcriptional regulator [Myxococcota bacterium]|nr:sigma 54-interacting transcriptional regulator [Myxococcota bacterium]